LLARYTTASSVIVVPAIVSANPPPNNRAAVSKPTFRSPSITRRAASTAATGVRVQPFPPINSIQSTSDQTFAGSYPILACSYHRTCAALGDTPCCATMTNPLITPMEELRSTVNHG